MSKHARSEAAADHPGGIWQRIRGESGIALPTGGGQCITARGDWITAGDSSVTQKTMALYPPLSDFGVLAFSPGRFRIDFERSANQIYAEALIRSADMAMYEAKSSGRAHCEPFDQQMQIQVATRLHIESDLHNALDEGELRLFFQPIISTMEQ